MLQADKPDDFVVSTGETHTVREFVELSFAEVGMKITWEGEGVNEVGKDPSGRTCFQLRVFDLLLVNWTCVHEIHGSWEKRFCHVYNLGVVIKIDPAYFRPTEVDLLLGDPAKIKKTLGWKPKVTFKELVKDMMART